MTVDRIARRLVVGLVGTALAFSFATALAAEQESATSEAFKKSLDTLLDSHRGEVSAAVKHLGSGETYQYKADRPMPTASLIKFPVMVTLYHHVDEGKIDLEKPVTLREEDKVPGSGVLTSNFSAGLQMPLRDAVRLMISFSDNTATNLVVDQVGLPATAGHMKSLGLPNTRLHSKVFRRDTSIDMERSREFGLGSTTANEMVALLEKLNAGELGSEEGAKAMHDHLLSCTDRTLVPRHVPSDTPVAHKTGSVSAVRTDAGIIESAVGPIAYAFLTNDNADRSWSDDNEAALLAAEFGRLVYAHFVAPESADAPAAARVLKVGADGLLVEALQRTLNARLDPSPQLGVDGDFGPNTESAVTRFQKEFGVEVTGEVGPDTWRALGPLVSEDDPVAEPEEVNSAAVVKAEPDPLTGPPFVTCKAYAIADAETGEVLWGYEDHLPRDPASVTKIMTAHLVATLAEQDPAVLDEIITFSKRADETSGSTSAVRAGEMVKVSDALYGLMLPSGNDMSVAFAEHFGRRLVAEAGEDESPYDCFLRAMNERADALSMHDTGYKNPHGLTAKGHQTTAADMVKLAYAALAQPVLREVVKTPTWGCTLSSVDGYERNVVWRNTNRLTRIEGYYGVKTGTTGPAGACLVSAGQRGGREIIIVTLGSSSSDARYADTRNLYRWAWRQLGVE